MTAQHLLCAVAVCAVMAAVTSQSDADPQTAQKPGLFGSTLRAMTTPTPYGVPGVGGLPYGYGSSDTAKAIAAAQAATAVAGAVSTATARPEPSPQPTPAEPIRGTSSNPRTPELRPDQKRAVELSIAGVDPAQRPFMYEQMAKNLAPYDEKQIAALIKGLEASASKEQIEIADSHLNDTGPVEGALSAADFAYNRAQYEPVIRKAWEAQKKYDDFVNAKMAAYCPDRDTAARWGSAWRYELHQFRIPSATASWNPDTDVQVMGSAYAPQDGRYNFDFSKVRYSFDEKAADAAIKEACSAFAAKGVEFLAKLDPMIAKEDWSGAFKLEQTANAGIEPIRAKLDQKLEPLSPNYGYPLMAALQNGKRVKS